MAVLFGVFDAGTSATEKEGLHALSEELTWPGATSHSIQFHSFSGGLLLHPSLGKDLTDYLYTDEEEQVLVLVSGHFYNRDELTALLGAGSREMTLPALAYSLFRQLGKGFAEKMNGDFTIIICQPASRSMLIFRDHLGIRPLCYTVHNNTCWFSSNGIALCKALYGDEKINPDYLTGYLKYPDEMDMNLLPCSKAKKLLPGHYLEWSAGKTPAMVRYWFPERNREDSSLDAATAISTLGGLVRDAVSIRADRAYKAATHLSGGLDSGIVAALARKQYRHQDVFKGFSWSPGFDDYPLLEADERKLVWETGQQCGIAPSFLDMKKEEVARVFDDGRFLGESFHEVCTRERARRENIHLVFSGWGGDEFISINDRGIPSDLFFKGHWRLFFQRFPIKKPVKTLKFIVKEILLRAAGIDWHEVRKKERQRYRYLNNHKPGFRLFLSPLYKWRSRRGVHLALLRFGHLAERAEMWFNNAYPEGIEYRYPLLDRRIIETMLRVPSNLLYKKRFVRLMLREISAGILPDAVTWSNSKDNLAMFGATKKHCRELFADAMQEMEEFKMNPDLGFVNFEALENDIRKFSDHSIVDELPEYLVTPLTLKRLHAFTMAYYSQRPESHSSSSAT